ncbi:hypothetical protein JW848_02415, partial [Candidatus Bipolaricaulota bacterium]|nr:hypothetical protein [Candidatus Bipolaricaulota bacterium]
SVKCFFSIPGTEPFRFIVSPLLSRPTSANRSFSFDRSCGCAGQSLFPNVGHHGCPRLEASDISVAAVR